MPRAKGKGSLLDLALEPGSSRPLSQQLYAELRAAILNGRLRAGDRLPASRVLAAELGVSRNTSLAALEQLIGEGYVEARRGSGSYVAQSLPDARPARLPAPSKRLAPRRLDAESPDAASPKAASLSRRGRMLAATLRTVSRDKGAWWPCFAPGVPDCSDFPFDLWARLLARAWRRPDAGLYEASDPAGHPALRVAIADHLRQARGVDCAPEQVIVLSGIRQAVDLTCRLLLDPGDAAWVEDPGYPGLRAAIAGSGARLVQVPVDGEGLVVSAGIGLAARARLACVAPSHQFPLGVALSLQRRLQLLAWAREARAWLLEDDYDSEFRYEGRPLATLQSLDEDGRVIYVGTLSKMLFPSLRVGYLVAPKPLAEAFRSARAAIDDHPPMAAQPALATFFAEGHLAAHVRRMRKRYRERQQLLLAGAARHLGPALALQPDPAGLHLVARLSGKLAETADSALAARLAAAGISAPALSSYYAAATDGRASPARDPATAGLMLGYAAVPDAMIDRGLQRMAEVLRL